MVESAAENATNKTAASSEPAAAEAEESKVEEQPPFMEETFSDPVLPELKLPNSWTLWEHYEDIQGNKLDYTQSMCKACWFNDLISFATAWNTIPHSDLRNVFFDDETKKVKM